MRHAPVLLVCALACGGGSANRDAAPGVDGAARCEQAGPTRVTLTTDDGVDLIADLYTTGTPGAPGVLLLHMIPPSNSLTNYTPEFIAAVRALGVNVLNINRRGAPGSGGVAADAYQGPSGWLDAKAGASFLIHHACAVPAARIAVVGASNGTTTTVDYAIAAAKDPALAPPVALVFLSPGTYTENQNVLKDHLDALAPLPIDFNYPQGEASWNEAEKAGAPTTWQFHPYVPGAHGTHLFESNPEVIGDVAGFLRGAFAPPG